MISVSGAEKMISLPNQHTFLSQLQISFGQYMNNRRREKLSAIFSWILQ